MQGSGQEEIQKIQKEVDEILEEAQKLFDSGDFDRAKEKLDVLRTQYLGKKGKIQGLFKLIPSLPDEQKRTFGKAVNELKERANARMLELYDKIEKAKRKTQKPDISLDSRGWFWGNLHPVTVALREITTIFEKMGFEVEEGPEIEDDWHNFTALNIPPEHPARDMQDTFYLEGGKLLRTHTSPVQIRALRKRKGKLPVKIIAPGKVFRRDWDPTHSPVFHQVEGLYVTDGKVSMADLFGVMEFFFKRFFGEEIKVRFRPSYFPFTEPSAEADISCFCGGKQDCKVCKGSGFLEVAGCGMVHPEVFKNAGWEGVRGFAFGMGVERLCMIKFQIPDIRLLFGAGYLAFRRRIF